MDAENPYASPRYTESDFSAATPTATPQALLSNLWRSGDKLIVPSGATLPAFCPKCGEAAEGQTRVFKASWTSAWRSVPLLAAALLLYWFAWTWWQKPAVIVVLIAAGELIKRRLGKRGLVYYRFCPRHERLRVNTPGYATFSGVATVVVALGILLSSLSETNPNGSRLTPVILLYLICTFGGILTAWLATRASPHFSVQKIRGRYIWLSGLHRRLLDQVPEATTEQLAKLMAENP